MRIVACFKTMRNYNPITIRRLDSQDIEQPCALALANGNAFRCMFQRPCATIRKDPGKGTFDFEGTEQPYFHVQVLA